MQSVQRELDARENPRRNALISGFVVGTQLEYAK